MLVDEKVRWRLGSKARSQGRYWFVETGRGAERRSLSLGYLTESQALACLDTMHREEERTAGTPDYGRVFRLHERNAELAIEFLIHDKMGELGSTLSD